MGDDPVNMLPSIDPRVQSSTSRTRRKHREATEGRGTSGTLEREELPKSRTPPRSEPAASIFGRSESGAAPSLEPPLERQALPLSSAAAAPSTRSESTESEESESSASSGLEEFESKLFAYKATTFLAMQASLLDLLATWWSDAPSCCLLHALLQDAMKAASALMKQECNNNLEWSTEWQCP